MFNILRALLDWFKVKFQSKVTSEVSNLMIICFKEIVCKNNLICFLAKS